MDEAELIDRSMRFAVQVTRFLGTLRDTQEGRHISWQWFECSTSTAATYRSACRGCSRPDFVSKPGIVEEEADESVFRLEFIDLGGFSLNPKDLPALTQETSELRAIFAASHKTAKANLERSLRKSKPPSGDP